MVGSVGNTGNPQIQFANTFKPGPTPAEQVLERVEELKEKPQTDAEEVKARADEAQSENRAARREDISASSIRGSSLDISV